MKTLRLIFVLLFIAGMFAAAPGTAEVRPSPTRIVPYTQSISPPMDLSNRPRELQKMEKIELAFSVLLVLFGVKLAVDAKNAYRA